MVCLARLGEDDGSAPNRTQDVVSHVSGVDLYIDGHDHEEEQVWIEDASGNQVLVVETGCYTHAIGVVTWDGETFTPSLVKYGEYEGQDAAVAALVQSASDDLSTTLDILVTTTPFYLNGERNPGLRTQETNLGDLVADAIFWEASLSAEDTPDAAMINGGAIRASVAAGDITMREVINVLPFINFICTVQVSGAQLLEVLEAACAFTPSENGGFPQVAIITFEIDTSVPFVGAGKYPDSTFEKPANPGARVTITDVNGRGFDLDVIYTIASIDFLGAGGDTYYAFAEAASTTMKGAGYLLSDVLCFYLEDQVGAEVPSDYEKPQGRIVIK